MILQNIELLYKVRESVIKLFKDYYLITSEAKYKRIHGKKPPGMLTRIVKVSSRSCPLNFSSHLKILTPKKILEKITEALAQVEAGNISKNLLIKIRETTY